MHKQYHYEYYQAIIQLRPVNENLTNFVEKKIGKTKAWVSKRINMKNGVDYYVSSNKVARQIGKQLKKSFRGELKESKKLFSKDRLTSRDIYRVTVCFKLKEY